jgi:hypothetical protein
MLISRSDYQVDNALYSCYQWGRRYGWNQQIEPNITEVTDLGVFANVGRYNSADQALMICKYVDKKLVDCLISDPLIVQLIDTMKKL